MKIYPSKKSILCKQSLLALSICFANQMTLASTLEEVVVTAEHKQASLQDTQISISALSSDDIQDLGISNSSDLANIAPNVTVTSFQAGKGIGVNMRGMGQNETIITFDPAIGVYVDEVIIAKNVGAVLDVLDLERIEILRGPQGTLYGRNTMGGTVNYITKKPSDEFEGNIKATFGKFNQQDIRAVVNVPLLDASSDAGALNMRVTAANLTRDGLIDNQLAGAPNSELETKDRQVAMVHLQWEPSDDLKVLYTYDMSSIDEVPSTPFATIAYAVVPADHVLGLYAERPDDIFVDGKHFVKSDVDGHALHVDYNLSDSLTLKSITSYRELDQSTSADSDGSPVNAILTSDWSELEQFSQEFRFVGAAMGGMLDFSAGFFYMTEEGDLLNQVAVFGFPEQTFGSMDNENWALYGQATYHLSEKWNITAGLRYTEEEKKLVKWGNNLGFDPFNNVGKADPFSQTGDYDNLSPMVSIGYNWDENTLGYLKISSGYQSGGFNVRDVNEATFNQGFEEETILAYELGLKTDISDRVRLNVAAWFSDYDDKRVNNFDPDTLSNVVRNAGVVEIWGLEAELLAQLNEQFQLGMNYGHTDPKYVEYDGPNPSSPSEILDLRATRGFPYTPEDTFNIFLSYEEPVSLGVIKARLDYAYKDSYQFLAPAPEPNSQRSYNVVNARVSLDEIEGPGDTSMKVSMWVKNLRDESYYTTGVDITSTFGFAINNYAEPRTYGVDLQISF